jgi:hypothetical protein
MAIARILNNYAKKQDAEEGEETPAKKVTPQKQEEPVIQNKPVKKR